ncbi:hypothetical protein HJ590_01200 [Naumannella sp. ID2617S]|uniref:Uncharacterized protein n=1 Tax=Enemella dayhoffiae TaxID=2016507 RepID=A0A255H8U7_9ACTN|nr:hypothetical protein [Enemella dayhoffiae]NNG18205.1 hypothetical protein [Naumannella sp. ID2617S]OYO23977.1 hypothetical protein CGZ93_05595 [Enemella dayhoffiae]
MSRPEAARRTPDLVAFVAGALCTAVAGLVLWSAYGGRLDVSVLRVAIPVLLVLLGAGVLVIRGRGH